MEENKLNIYRLTGMEEPTDEQLSALMKEVAEEAKIKSEEAHNKFFKQMNDKIQQQKKEWTKKYNVKFNNA